MKSELDSSYERYRDSLTEMDIGLQGDFHKYMCIRLSGYLEQLIFEAISGYMATHAHGAVRSFSMSFFKRAPNLNPEKFEELIRRFGEPWASDFEDFLNRDERRNSLGKLLEVRNKVAHGHNYRGGQLNVATYKQLVDSIHVWVIDKLL